MTALKQIYKCNICGNIVEVLHAGAGELVCCGQPMQLLVEKNQDIGQEKHVPVIEKTVTGVKVKVGSIPHPMEEKHYIEWIEIIADGRIYRKFLKPGNNLKRNLRFRRRKLKLESIVMCMGCGRDNF